MLMTRACSSALLVLGLAAGISGCSAKRDEPPVEQRIPATSLVGTEWRVVDIGGTAVIDSAQTAVTFSPEGNVSGSTGCNSFTGTAKIDADNLTFAPLATTRKACTDPLMSQEQTFLKAIEAVHRFSIDPNGQLLLLGADGQTLMRLARAAP